MAGTADSHRTAWPRRDRRRARRGMHACATAGPVLSLLGAPDDLIGPGAASLRVMAFAVAFAAVSFTLQGVRRHRSHAGLDVHRPQPAPRPRHHWHC